MTLMENKGPSFMLLLRRQQMVWPKKTVRESKCTEHAPEAHNTEPDDSSPSWFLTEEQMMKLQVDELRSSICAQGLKPKGNKSALQQMLSHCMERQLPIVDVLVANVNELSGFPVGSRWKLLTASATPAQEPVNMFDFWAPTDNQISFLQFPNRTMMKSGTDQSSKAT